MGNILTLSNQKGGTSKSTSAVHLGAALKIMGKKVLIVDFDPQGDASTYPGFDDDSWKTPVIAKTGMELKAQVSAPLTVRDILPVVRKYKNSKGNWVFDFGQNFSGIIRLKVKGHSGHNLLLSHVLHLYL